jgi:hypothetical protein
LRLAVVEVALHLPLAKMKLSLGAALQTRAISAPAAGKWTAEVCVPTTENSRHEITNLYCYVTGLHLFTSFKIAFDSITRKLWSDWATTRREQHNQRRNIAASAAFSSLFWWPRFWLILSARTGDLTIEQTPR